MTGALSVRRDKIDLLSDALPQRQYFLVHVIRHVREMYHKPSVWYEAECFPIAAKAMSCRHLFFMGKDCTKLQRREHSFLQCAGKP